MTIKCEEEPRSLLGGGATDDGSQCLWEQEETLHMWKVRVNCKICGIILVTKNASATMAMTTSKPGPWLPAWSSLGEGEDEDLGEAVAVMVRDARRSSRLRFKGGHTWSGASKFACCKQFEQQQQQKQKTKISLSRWWRRALETSSPTTKWVLIKLPCLLRWTSDSIFSEICTWMASFFPLKFLNLIYFINKISEPQGSDILCSEIFY